MRKIGVFLNTEPYVGGTFQYNQSILDALENLNNSIYTVVAIYTNATWKRYLSRYNFQLYEVEYDIYSMPKKIDLLHCDLIICPSQDCLPGLISTKTIGTIHDLMHRYEKKFPEVSADGEYELRERLYKTIYEYSEAILVDSTVGKQHVMESYGALYKDKIYPLPFTPPKYLYNVSDSADIKEKWKLPNKYIFYPAQFWQHKNHKNLLLALVKLRGKKLNVNLILVGSKKNEYNNVINLIKKENLEKQVQIRGYVSDKEMCFLYKNARAMIMPTFFGPTNIPALEGFLMGCPVAVSNIYGMPEQVKNAALLFDPNNIDEIATSIEKLWCNDYLCNALIDLGYERLKYFSADLFTTRLESIIIDVFMKNKDASKYIDTLVEFCHKHKYIFCYGAGEYGYWIRVLLAAKGITPTAFIVSEKQTAQDQYLDLPVYTVTDIRAHKKECAFILSLQEQHHVTIIDILQKKDYTVWYAIKKNHMKEVYAFFTTIKGELQRKMFDQKIKME